MTEPELRALAWKAVEGRVVGAWMVPQDLWSVVFMPIMWMAKKDLLAHKNDTFYAIVGEDRDLGRAVNGFPIFTSCRFISRADLARVDVLVEELRAQKAAFLTNEPHQVGTVLANDVNDPAGRLHTAKKKGAAKRPPRKTRTKRRS